MNIEHDVSAYYSSDGDKYRPVMECSCGFISGRCSDWEEAGIKMDNHFYDLRNKKGTL